jgi:formamidopyrimidine-DNA glycosylase
MPELPDVEAFRSVLSKNALHKEINRVVVTDNRILGALPVKTFASGLAGATLVVARRHGKHLLTKIDRGGWLTLHFGLTGALSFVATPRQEPPFTRVRLDFSADGCLAYTNKRMIGRVSLADDADQFIASEELGPDALDPSFDFRSFKAAVLGVKRDAKTVLMDQRIIAGIGNIYSDEILFQARVNPFARMDELSPDEVKRLFRKMREVLATAVATGAGSETFVERMPKGSLLPERKKEGHCPRCGARLKALKVGGRTAYCCANCQNC